MGVRTGRQVAEAISRGDAGAAEALMRRNNGRLYRLLRSILADEQEAEDALQETYIRAFANMGQFSGVGDFDGWLYTIALNEGRARLRRRRRLAGLADIAETELDLAMRRHAHTPIEDPEDRLARSEMRHLLERAVDELPPHFRSVFVLRAVEMMSAREVAGLLGLSEETVRTRFHRARALLRRSITQEAEGILGDLFAFAGERCDRVVARVLRSLQFPQA